MFSGLFCFLKHILLLNSSNYVPSFSHMRAFWWCPMSVVFVQPELPENWTDTKETLLEGMVFNVKYLGMTLVGQPKGEDMASAAIRRIVATVSHSCSLLMEVISADFTIIARQILCTVPRFPCSYWTQYIWSYWHLQTMLH